MAKRITRKVVERYLAKIEKIEDELYEYEFSENPKNEEAEIIEDALSGISCNLRTLREETETKIEAFDWAKEEDEKERLEKEKENKKC